MPDTQARSEALNPKGSYIVQAPAGSGKTELLTQRFLALLAVVDKMPEEVLAVTFTRKAAAQMRMRILEALQAGQQENPPDNAYQRTTWQLAQAALKRDEALGWRIIENPNRLRVMTIDGLASHLTARMPILSQMGAQPTVSLDPKKLYTAAIENLLKHLDANNPLAEALCDLLRHVDNRIDRLEGLLSNLLGIRDQWLGYIIGLRTQSLLREQLENSLRHIVSDHLEELEGAWPEGIQAPLESSLAFAFDTLGEEWRWPSGEPEDLPLWGRLCDLLLVKEGAWRKSVTKQIGFPAPSSAKNKEEKALYAQQKTAFLEILDTLREEDSLCTLLAELRYLPPLHYTQDQWQLIESLVTVLPVLVAELTVVCREHGEVDFVMVTQSALAALGEEESPTDLALQLDYQIHHLLVDEFQDTSMAQFSLFERLVRGWAEDAGRSLFLVGDPMQSIYRFRGAEVGLFLKAQQSGLGGIALTALQLLRNFRSSETLVEWTNQVFAKLFPLNPDMGRGAIPYAPATFTQPASKGISCLVAEQGPKQEAEQLVDWLIQVHAQNPEASVAILVRSRLQLTHLLPTLKKASILFQAHDIERLASRPWVLDLQTVARALLDLTDRIAWLALLRAPWCGLSLQDLAKMVELSEGALIWACLESSELLEALSPDGQNRLKKLYPILSRWQMHRRRLPLAQWVKGAWQALGGAALIPETASQDIDTVLACLETQGQGGDLPDWSLLETQLETLYASSQESHMAWLEIMTIHKAKGLEFDVVILPGLESLGRGIDTPLLRWYERPTLEGLDYLLAPCPAYEADSDPVYRYVSYQEKQKDLLENTRLLYVAVTRAKSQLLCSGSVIEETLPKKNSFLGQLWPWLPQKQSLPITTEKSAVGQREVEGHHRLPLTWKPPYAVQDIIDRPESARLDTENAELQEAGFEYEPIHQKAIRLTGIFIHRILEQIANKGLAYWPVTSLPIYEIGWRKGLLQAGVPAEQVQMMLQRTYEAIENTLNCSIGQWILGAHSEAKAEWEISFSSQGEVRQVILDRTFIDEKGTRWIVDYKTSTAYESTLEEAVEQYSSQLEQYARLLKAIDNRPIQVGLYFPLRETRWHFWTPGKPSTRIGVPCAEKNKG